MFWGIEVKIGGFGGRVLVFFGLGVVCLYRSEFFDSRCLVDDVISFVLDRGGLR